VVRGPPESRFSLKRRSGAHGFGIAENFRPDGLIQPCFRAYPCISVEVRGAAEEVDQQSLCAVSFRSNHFYFVSVVSVVRYVRGRDVGENSKDE
jgi:hypothetical protein